MSALRTCCRPAFLLALLCGVNILVHGVRAQAPEVGCKIVRTNQTQWKDGVNIWGGTKTVSKTLSESCKLNATLDLRFRTLNMSQWATPICYSSTTDYWGPNAANYPEAPPANIKCYTVEWARYRLMQFGHWAVNESFNYCHHNTPSWLPPDTAFLRKVCANCSSEDIPDCTCSSAGMSNAKPWQGVDCSNFVAFLYNMAFGAPFTSGIDSQACHPDKAPGRLLTTTLDTKLFKAGDLLYISSSSTSGSISHVIMWTDYTVDCTNKTLWRSPAYLANQTSTCSRSYVHKGLVDSCKAKVVTPIVLDSTFNGPRFRAFFGWYKSAFSHARRVIAPSATLPLNDPTVLNYTSSAGCVNLRQKAAGSAAAATAATTMMAAAALPADQGADPAAVGATAEPAVEMTMQFFTGISEAQAKRAPQEPGAESADTGKRAVAGSDSDSDLGRRRMRR